MAQKADFSAIAAKCQRKSNPKRRYTSRKHRDSLNLNQTLFAKEILHPGERAHRRVLHIDVPIANSPQRLQTICIQPNDVVVKLHQIERCGAILSKDRRQVLEGLFCLCIEVIFRNVAAFISAYLTR